MINDGFYAAREMFVMGAKVDGNVDLTGVELNPGTDGTVTPIPDRATSLMANLVRVHGTIVVRNSIIHGYLRLLNAKIDGDLLWRAPVSWIVRQA
jgi:hypothetical protein